MWCPHTDSNREPIDYKSIALPIELWGPECFFKINLLKKQYKLILLSTFWIEKYDDIPQRPYLIYLSFQYYRSFLL